MAETSSAYRRDAMSLAPLSRSQSGSRSKAVAPAAFLHYFAAVTGSDVPQTHPLIEARSAPSFHPYRNGRPTRNQHATRPVAVVDYRSGQRFASKSISLKSNGADRFNTSCNPAGRKANIAPSNHIFSPTYAKRQKNRARAAPLVRWRRASLPRFSRLNVISKLLPTQRLFHPRSRAWRCGLASDETASYRLRRSRRALRFLLPIFRRRRGLAMRLSPFSYLSYLNFSIFGPGRWTPQPLWPCAVTYPLRAFASSATHTPCPSPIIGLSGPSAPRWKKFPLTVPILDVFPFGPAAPPGTMARAKASENTSSSDSSDS